MAEAPPVELEETGSAAVLEAMDAAVAGNDASRWTDKIPVRDRIALLLDPGTWVEDGLLANATADGLPADGVLTGVGEVHGRRVAVIAHDFAVKAGSWGELNVEKQVVIIYAGTQGYVDKLPVDSLRSYEEELYRFIDEKHADLWEDIRSKKEITDEIKKKLVDILKTFGKQFVANKE